MIHLSHYLMVYLFNFGTFSPHKTVLYLDYFIIIIIVLCMSEESYDSEAPKYSQQCFVQVHTCIHPQTSSLCDAFYWFIEWHYLKFLLFTS